MFDVLELAEFKNAVVAVGQTTVPPLTIADVDHQRRSRHQVQKFYIHVYGHGKEFRHRPTTAVKPVGC